MQALKDMDSITLKKVLGQVSAASLHVMPSRATLCTNSAGALSGEPAKLGELSRLRKGRLAQ